MATNSEVLAPELQETPADLSSVRVCAITCDTYPEDPLVRRTAEAAARAGCEYHIICSQEKGESAEEIFNSVHVHRLPLIQSNGELVGRISARPLASMLILWTRFAFKATRRLAALASEKRCDIVHVHNMPDFLVFAALPAKLKGARVILEIQDVSPELMAVKSRGLLRRVAVSLAAIQERLSTAFSDHVITVGWPFEEPLLRRGVPAAKLTSILNSADPSIFSPEKCTDPYLGPATAERPLILMYHGTCAVRNGLDTAIWALAKALPSAPHLRLHVRGGGENLPNLEKLAHELGVAHLVTFFPYGALETVADFVSDGDIGIIPYRSDGFMDLVLPTKAYELALMRRPIIACNTPAVRWMFRPESVALCEPSNVDQYAERIVELYHSPAKRAEMVKNAEEDNRKFRWEIMAARYQQLLLRLSKKRATNPIAGEPN
jgi:glycosyltransferase involved in cell wall biosynthesis